MDRKHPADRLRGYLFLVYSVIIGLSLLLRVVSVGVGPTIYGVLELLLFNSFVGSLFLGTFLGYSTLKRRPRELAWVLGLGLVMEVIMAKHRFLANDPLLVALTFGVGLGSASILIGLLPRTLRGDEPDARRRLLSPLLMILSYFVGHFTVGLVAQNSPLVYDLYAFAVDLNYHYAAAFKIRLWMLLHPSMKLLLELVYGGLAAAMVGAQLHFFYRPNRYHMDPTICFILLGTFGGLLYSIAPMVGAAEFFGQVFPRTVPGEIAPQPIPFNNLMAPRNTIPSLHGAWALSCWWSTWRGGRSIRWIMALVFLLTVPAALSTGHYIIDIVLAFPLTMGVHSLVILLTVLTQSSPASQLRRWSSLGTVTGIGGCALSIWVLREFPGFFLSSELLLWIWTIGCMGYSWWLETRIRRLSVAHFQGQA